MKKSIGISILFALIFSGCNSEPPSTEIVQVVKNSLFEYSQGEFSLKSFTPIKKEKTDQSGVEVTLTKGTAIITTNAEGIVGSGGNIGDETHPRWKSYPQNYTTLKEFATFPESSKLTWKGAKTANLKAGSEIEVTNITVGCWYGASKTDPNSTWHCYRPKNDESGI